MFKPVGESFKETAKEVKRGIKEELEKILLIVQIIFPIILVKCNINLWEMLFASMTFLFFVSMFKKVDRKINSKSESGFPLPPYQFVTVDPLTGFMEFAEGKEEEAILYLDELQEYLKAKGIKGYE